MNWFRLLMVVNFNGQKNLYPKLKKNYCKSNRLNNFSNKKYARIKIVNIVLISESEGNAGCRFCVKP